MPNKRSGQAQPEAAHAQPANPQTAVLEKKGLAGPPYQEQLDAAGQARPDTHQTRLQDLLPEVTELAQKVGGYKKLAEIAETLEKTKE